MSDAREPSVYNLVRGDALAGRYEIVREIGSGGMGRVFEAYDRALKERVAVKVLKNAPDEEARSRFVNEVKLARKIRHRNVVGLHEYGEEGGLPYFSMELVEGEDLRHLILARGALDWEAAYALAELIGAGLQAAHEMGVVHRDLKPANVMIEPSGQVRVMDFGVAKGGGERSATQVGVAIGTPEYMSPEQVLGGEVDPRSDLYAFGVVIHEMFTGCVPFSGPNPHAVMVMHIDRPPLDPPDVRLPGPLIPILRKALAKSRDDRYGSCGELLEALAAARRAQGTDPLSQALVGGDSGKDATLVLQPKVNPRSPNTAVPPEARLLLPMLIRALESPQVEVRLGAIHALGLHGPAAAGAFPRLQSLVHDPAVGEAAALALRAIAPAAPNPAPPRVALETPLPARSSLPGPTGGNASRAGPDESLDAQGAASPAPDLVTPAPVPAPAPQAVEPAVPPPTLDFRPPSPVPPDPAVATTSWAQPQAMEPPPAVEAAPVAPAPPAPKRVFVPPPDPVRSPDRSSSAPVHRRRVVALALAGVALVAGLIYSLIGRPTLPSPPSSVPTTTVALPPPPQGTPSPAPPAMVPTTASSTTTTSTPQRPRPDPGPRAKAVAPRVPVTPSPLATAPVTPTPGPPPTPEALPLEEPATTTTSTTTTTTTTYRFVPPECERCPSPPFPEIARDPRVAAQGRVDLRLMVDDKGGVAVLGAVYRALPPRPPATPAGRKILEDAAVAAVKKWRFRPALRDGVPVPMEVTAKADFILSE